MSPFRTKIFGLPPSPSPKTVRLTEVKEEAAEIFGPESPQPTIVQTALTILKIARSKLNLRFEQHVGYSNALMKIEYQLNDLTTGIKSTKFDAKINFIVDELQTLDYSIDIDIMVNKKIEALSKDPEKFIATINTLQLIRAQVPENKFFIANESLREWQIKRIEKIVNAAID